MAPILPQNLILSVEQRLSTIPFIGKDNDNDDFADRFVQKQSAADLERRREEAERIELETKNQAFDDYYEFIDDPAAVFKEKYSKMLQDKYSVQSRDLSKKDIKELRDSGIRGLELEKIKALAQYIKANHDINSARHINYYNTKKSAAQIAEEINDPNRQIRTAIENVTAKIFLLLSAAYIARQTGRGIRAVYQKFIGPELPKSEPKNPAAAAVKNEKSVIEIV